MEIQFDASGAAARAQVGAEARGAAIEGAAVERAAPAALPGGGSVPDAAASPLARYLPLMPSRPAHAASVESFAPAVGYASTPEQPSAAAKAPAARRASSSATAAARSSSSSRSSSTSKKKTSAKSSASKELAFLDSKTMSVEDKLFQFMVVMQQRSDAELAQAMKDYGAKSASSSSSTSSSSSAKSSGSGAAKAPAKQESSGGGLFGFVGDVLGGAVKAVGGVAEKAASELGGPVLAAAATALGAPFLAPIALEVGGTVASGLVHAATTALGGEPSSSAGGSPASGSGSGGAASGGATSASTSKASASPAAADTEFDERLEAMKLQRLVDKQSQMFTTISNVLKAMHDTQMAAIANIR